jgi:hypothetical protein
MRFTGVSLVIVETAEYLRRTRAKTTEAKRPRAVANDKDDKRIDTKKLHMIGKTGRRPSSLDWAHRLWSIPGECLRRSMPC